MKVIGNVSTTEGLIRLSFQGSFITADNDDMEDHCNDTLRNPSIVYGDDIESRRYASTSKKAEVAHECQYMPTETGFGILGYSKTGSKIGTEYSTND